MLQLQREGWIEAKVNRTHERGRTGRPATSYNLTEAGDHLFPKNYDLLNVAVLDAVTSEFGSELAKKVLRRVSDERVAAIKPGVADLPLDKRVEALRNLYSENDPYMEVESVDDGFLLVERNCPYFNTAMQRPALCSISVDTLIRVLGVRVEREERFQDGAGRCVFHIYAKEPVDPESWAFKLESE